ncbi:MAG: hypothetical protein RL662_1505 [Bacteroidota bacterium]|jgi:hypothetical protein
MIKNILTVFATIIILGLTSCSNDTYEDGYWVDNSYLDMEFRCKGDNNGFFTDATKRYTFYNLGEINPNRDEVLDIRLQDTWIELYGDFFDRDVIQDLTISVQGVGHFICPRIVLAGFQNKIIIDNNIAPGYYQFMSRAMLQLVRSGNLIVTVSGYHNARFTDIDVIVSNDLDILVR